MSLVDISLASHCEFVFHLPFCHRIESHERNLQSKSDSNVFRQGLPFFVPCSMALPRPTAFEIAVQVHAGMGEEEEEAQHHPDPPEARVELSVTSAESARYDKFRKGEPPKLVLDVVETI